jgi:hypothetical protein
MHHLRNSRVIRPIALLLCLVMLIQVVTPLQVYALTSGPAQPEFSSFEPVGTVKMVDEFTGDLTYNLPVLEIPGPEGSSYPLSLSYHSGTSPEEDASWVGYGWTLNPGAIQRGKAGYPDDFKGAEVKEYNKVPANWTASLSGYVGGLELFSNDVLSANVNASVRYNNYRGFGYTVGVGMSRTGTGSLGYSISDGEGSFSLRLNVADQLGEASKNHNEKTKRMDESKQGKNERFNRRVEKRKNLSSKLRPSTFGISLPGREIRPTAVTPYVGTSFNISINGQFNPAPFPVGPEFGVTGGYSYQDNIGTRNLQAYGYLYSHGASEDDLMDYYVERQIPYEVHDKYLGIPFSSPDNFSATGEALSGGFRLHSKRVGHFHPNQAISLTTIVNIPVELMTGLNSGVGTDGGAGINTLEVGEWDDLGYTFGNTGDEPYYFRFTGDKGGAMDGGSHDAKRAVINTVSQASAPSGLPTTLNDGLRLPKTSYIGYNLNSKMDSIYAHNPGNSTMSDRPLYSYTKDTNLISSPTIDRTSNPDGIGELAITNSGGVQYLYSLPVYSRNENNLSYLLRRVDGGSVSNNYKVYANYTKETANHYVGNAVATPYASQYLLTEIRQPDYVDRTLDGPTDDDFGGWTSLSYKKVYGHGASGGWYKWRMPYNGLQYDRNEMSNNMDDVGTVSYGEKEMYYLDTIETRTHFAAFITTTRLDGVDAASSEATASTDSTADGTHTPLKLDQIKLYRKGPNGPELIKVVNFQYDYTAWGTCGDLPNASQSGGIRGKLTLRRVWFDYEGAYNARISPYEFYYKYPRTGGTYPGPVCSADTVIPAFATHLTVDYPAKYDSLENYGYYKDEIPPYDPLDIDAWGNYQMGGRTRHAAFQPWMNQVPEDGTPGSVAGFDPAAYQLKAVKLPSGGQIHIHYEQDDYQWVQDRPAMAMVHIDTVSGQSDEFYLETVNDLGIPLSDDRTLAIREMMEERFENGKEKIYFKFLYSLTPLVDPDLGNCVSEWIDGYASVEDVHFIGGSGNRIKVTLESGGYKSPRNVCDDLLRTSKAGKLRPFSTCDASQDALDRNGSPMHIFQELGAWLLTGRGAVGCGKLDGDNAYLRIPIPKKLGGGLRVKRIFMYDAGLEPDNADKVLYGTEYDYTMEDGSSSGVATKEPGPSRMEDPLVNVLDRYHQNIISRVISGKDKKQNEGPLGESMLPPASVGYRRVLSKSIHQGMSSPGFSVNQYYTCKDFPFDRQYPSIDSDKAFHATPLSTLRSFIPELAGLLPITYGRDNRALTQGYRFVLFDIHGQPKSFETFAGSWDDVNDVMTTNNLKKISSQEFSYFMPGDTLSMMDDVDSYLADPWYPGKEVEIVTESRKAIEINVNGRLESDVSISLLLGVPVPMFGLGPNLNYAEHKLRSHVTTKVERYPAIQKSVKSYQDGIYHLTENIAFNPETGEPVVSRTTDSYHGLDLEQGHPTLHNGQYRAYSIPASRHYTAMGAKSSNERLFIESNANFTLNKYFYGSGMYLEVADNSGGTSSQVCSIIEKLTPGSKVLLRKTTNGSIDGIYTLGESNGGSIELLKSGFYNWGTVYNGGVTLLILESGKKNRLNDNLGGFTTYGAVQTVTYTPGNATVNSTRETYADSLTANVTGIGSTAVDLEVGSCVFKNAYSTDVAIRITRMGSSPDYYLLVELVDWEESAAVIRCSEMIPNFSGGHFEIDGESGELVFFADGNDCYPYKLPCLQFCDPNYAYSTLPKVVVAGANTLSDEWPFDTLLFGNLGLADLNVYETGERGKWRVDKSYKYRTSIVGGAQDNGTERTYNDAGTFELNLFNYGNPLANDPTEWLCLSTVTQYSPYGMAMEEKDILGIYSNAHFGYKQTVPLLTAQNSVFDQCYFESFEMTYGSPTQVEEGVEISSTLLKTDTVHAGRKSYQLNSELELRPFRQSLQTLRQGLSVMVWVHDPSYGTESLDGELRVGTTSFLPLHFIWEARAGLWNLYEAKVAPNANWGGIVVGDIVTPVIFKNSTLTCKIIVDDIRYQPLDAKMACYVYDPATLKPLCSFDDQHFGTYSQYNGEGKLVRKLIETERGMRTVQENQYHSPLQVRQ